MTIEEIRKSVFSNARTQRNRRLRRIRRLHVRMGWPTTHAILKSMVSLWGALSHDMQIRRKAHKFGICLETDF